MPVLIPTITVEESDSFSHLLEQYVYLTNENESLFFIKTFAFPNLTARIDRFLLFSAILKAGGYTPASDNGVDVNLNEFNNKFSTVFHHHLNNNFSARNHEAFKSTFHRSQSGHWSYIVK